jgi:hypothetical protein
MNNKSVATAKAAVMVKLYNLTPATKPGDADLLIFI